MGKTKLVYTMEPFTEDAELLDSFLLGGMDVVKCMFPEESDSAYTCWIQKIKQHCRQQKHPVAILMDTAEKVVRKSQSGILTDVDFVVTSILHSKEDIDGARRFLDENGCVNTQIIVTMDGQQEREKLKELLDAADGIMLTFDPLWKKEQQENPQYLNIIRYIRAAGKIIVTKTQILDFKAG